MDEMQLNEVKKTEELQEYRVKYLQAQQEVEELKKQIHVMELDNKQVSNLIQTEVQTVRMQFHEKLEELAPLPDLLKGAQLQLKEAKQLQTLAEGNALQNSKELQLLQEKYLQLTNKYKKIKGGNDK